jgi:hypothetical protein
MSKNIKIKIYSNKTINLPVVTYGRETWYLILREEHRLRVFEKRVLGGIFGPERNAVIAGWIQLQIEEFRNLYSLPDIIGMIKSRRTRWIGHIARMGRREMPTVFWWESQKKT